MAHISLLIARIVVVCFSALLMYVAFFLHEDEEGKIQNRLERLWVQIDDLKSQALAKDTLFLRELAKLLGAGFDSLLGSKLFSVRSVVVTLCYSAASLSIFAALASATIPILGRSTGFETKEFLAMSIFFVLFMVMGTTSIALKRRVAVGIWAGLNVLILVGLFHWATRPMGWGLSDQIFITGALLGGIACDLCFVAINRAIVRVSAGLKTTTQIAMMLICNIAIAFVYISPLWLYPLSELNGPKDLANLIASSNLITALMACGIIVLMLIALLHRFFWPLISRPVYAIARHGLVRKPAFLLSTSILFLTWAIPAWGPFWEKLGHL